MIEQCAVIFQMRSGAGMAAAVVEMHIETEQRHQELLELLATQSDSQFSDAASSVNFMHRYCTHDELNKNYQIGERLLQLSNR